jgi:hypothetical protein
VNVGGKGGGGAGGCELAYFMKQDPATAGPYTLYPFRAPGTQLGEFFRENTNYALWSTDAADYPCWPTDAGAPGSGNEYPGVDPACLAAISHNGEGFFKELGGKELPNAPHITATITADYTLPLPSDWLMTLHTDLYYQSEAWARIFNTPGYDKLKAYSNVNLAAIFTNDDAGWKVMAYVKNVFDKTNITGAFLNSDDSGLTTNVFMTEPRLYGLRVSKDFNGGPWWTGANLNHTGPYPLTVEIGGQAQRQDAPFEALHTGWVDALPASIAPENVQDRDLDWGDGRSLKVTYQPSGSSWSVAAAFRYGRTNNDTARTNASSADIVDACRLPSWIPSSSLCEPGAVFYGYTFGFWHYVETTAWSDAEARSGEEHEIADFIVGRDVGIGDRLRSKISAGLRYADFQSSTRWAANAQGDWNVPVGWGLGAFPKYQASFKRRHVVLKADREFKGAGPEVTWEAALPVWGDDRTGRVNVDWSVGGAELFGKQKTTISGQDTTVLHQGNLGYNTGYVPDRSRSVLRGILPVVDTQTTQIEGSRSKDVTVSALDLSLGLSYEVGRIKLGTGYRWERYFDVLDVGQDEAKKGDRTIDGPYFKIAVGFGG